MTSAEAEFDILCRQLAYTPSGMLELTFHPQSWGDEITVRVRLRVSSVEGAERVLVLETLCARALKKLGEAKRQLNALADKLGVRLNIKE